MSAKFNKKLVEDMYVALNTKDLDAHDKYWHQDMIWHGPPGFGAIHGLENFKEQVMKMKIEYHLNLHQILNT